MASNHVIRTARLTDRQVLDLIFALKDNLKIRLLIPILWGKIGISLVPLRYFWASPIG